LQTGLLSAYVIKKLYIGRYLLDFLPFSLYFQFNYDMMVFQCVILYIHAVFL
jgi:DNA polymerase sigma